MRALHVPDSNSLIHFSSSCKFYDLKFENGKNLLAQKCSCACEDTQWHDVFQSSRTCPCAKKVPVHNEIHSGCTPSLSHVHRQSCRFLPFLSHSHLRSQQPWFRFQSRSSVMIQMSCGTAEHSSSHFLCVCVCVFELRGEASRGRFPTATWGTSYLLNWVTGEGPRAAQSFERRQAADVITFLQHGKTHLWCFTWKAKNVPWEKNDIGKRVCTQPEEWIHSQGDVVLFAYLKT